MSRNVWFPVFAVLGLALLGSGHPFAQQGPAPAPSRPAPTIGPTAHPPLPVEPTQFLMLPGPQTRTAALEALVTAVRLETEGSSAKALPILSQLRLSDHPLSQYAQYYRGLVELSLGRAADARRTLQSVRASGPVGWLAEAAALREGESLEGLGDHAAALAIYEGLGRSTTAAPDDVLMRIGRTAEAVGDLDRALAAFSRVFYEFPLSDLAPAARIALERLPGRPELAAGTDRFRLELRRADRLFAAGRYTEARAAFVILRGPARDDDEALADLRIAESDYYLGRPRAARDGLTEYLDRGPRQAEALFFRAAALYNLGDRLEYFRIIERLAGEFPNQPWTEEALNHLATHYIRADDNEKADGTFRRMFAAFPDGRYAERAAWKIGWLAYRNRQYRETIRVFEQGAATFPRSDYRPSWLYWSARAYEALKESRQAEARYRLTAIDYFNSYYGRLAVARLGSASVRQLRAEATAPPAAAQPGDARDAAGGPFPPNEPVVRALLGLGLYAQAVRELQYAQKVWGDSPAIQATLAWAYRQQGQMEKGGRPQFTLYRSAINTMKRAYPHYLATSGERLPDDVLHVIFPLAHWDLIRKHATANGLDPYLVAALVAQESTFVRDIRSSAGAVGLMQLLPATGRRMATQLKIPYASSLLTTPEPSIRLGTAYLAQHVKEFGHTHLVLASYNAGERAVRRWVAERPGLPADEFIDDIPYPETQGYVKRIIGTAEDYRRLYGE